MMNSTRLRLAATLPLAGLLAASLLAGCHHDTDENQAPVSTTPAPTTTTATPTMPGGPSGNMSGGTMSGGKMSSGAPGKGSGDNQVVGDPITTAKIKSALIADKTIDANMINVSTAEGGAVSLTGMVATAQQKMQAEKIAKQTQGVKKVMNYLKVGK